MKISVFFQSPKINVPTKRIVHVGVKMSERKVMNDVSRVELSIGNLLEVVHVTMRLLITWTWQQTKQEKFTGLKHETFDFESNKC